METGTVNLKLKKYVALIWDFMVLHLYTYKKCSKSTKFNLLHLYKKISKDEFWQLYWCNMLHLNMTNPRNSPPE